jgi:hypothetical protein
VLFQESLARLDIATAVNTADEAAQQRLAHYRQTILPIANQIEQVIEERSEAYADLLSVNWV